MKGFRMNIEIICVGKMKEKYFIEAMNEYEKRLSRFCKFQITQVPDCSIPDNASEMEERAILEKEGSLILNKLKKDTYVIAMCVEGKERTTEQFAKQMDGLGLQGKSHITFLIGGSLGLAGIVKEKADYLLSLSQMTLTHNMARVFLTEQIYRSFKINHGEKYHK